MCLVWLPMLHKKHQFLNSYLFTLIEAIQIEASMDMNKDGNIQILPTCTVTITLKKMEHVHMPVYFWLVLMSFLSTLIYQNQFIFQKILFCSFCLMPQVILSASSSVTLRKSSFFILKIHQFVCSPQLHVLIMYTIQVTSPIVCILLDPLPCYCIWIMKIHFPIH